MDDYRDRFGFAPICCVLTEHGVPIAPSGYYAFKQRPPSPRALRRVLAQIGTVSDSYDNAPAESVVGLYKTECVQLDSPFRTVDELELATLFWVQWFNGNRLHSSIEYVTPVET